MHLLGQPEHTGFLRLTQHYLWTSYEKWYHVFWTDGI